MENKNTKPVYTDYFKGSLSFASLIRFWESQAETDEVIAASFTQINERLKNAPELREPVTDESTIEKHRELIRDLLKICISPAIENFDHFACVYPDRNESFFETPSFRKLGFFESRTDSTCFNENCCLTIDGRNVAGFATILRAIYGLNVTYEYPVIFTRIDEKTGLEKHYRIRIFGWFCDMKKKAEIKPLSEAEKKQIFENLDDPRVLNSIVPADQFSFEGFFIFNAVDITDQETLSLLKFDLIGKESITQQSKFGNLQHKLRVLLRKPEIKLGLIAFPTDKKDMKNAMPLGNSIIMQNDFIENDIVGECRIYDDVIKNRKLKVVYDIKDYGCSPRVEEAMVSSNIRNLLVAPLIYKDELIGLLEIASSEPGDLNKVNILKLKDVYPLFALCIESSLDDLNKSVQSVIKEKCTAIHPTVEWRFREAALKSIKNLRNDIIEEMEDIVFDNVHPFYGCSDVKDSSFNRNAAIQADLIENLKLAQGIIAKATEVTPLPIIEELSYRISTQVDVLNSGLSSSNEVDVINFIRKEIGSTFEFLADGSTELRNLVNSYKSKLDPGFGFLFNKRREFEDSIQLINDTISTELDIQQEKAQKIFPHYFEKYKTDGVEYNMYLGSSLVADSQINQMHFKSLRLWQLTTTCIIARKCHELRNILKIPLDTTHLIFVQHAPITIKFLYDEKKFDVAGSYDIRHEIIKKRIDKAEIKGSNERLTSPCKIAIVYSLEAEADEYKQYINFLKTKNYITGDAESLELADMQSVHGLKALRISVNNELSIDRSTEENQNVKSKASEYLQRTMN